MVRPTHLLVVLVAQLGSGGCLYTTSINDRPQADIDVEIGSAVFPSDEVALSARRSSDTESSSLDCTWTTRFACAGEPGCPLPEVTQMPCSSDLIFRLPAGDEPGGHLPVEVELEVTDEDGARSVDVETVQPGNRPPVIVVQAPPLGTASGHVRGLPIVVSAEIEDPDRDPVSEPPRWELLKPRSAGTEVMLEQVDETGMSYRFTPDVADVWHVVVSADDGFAGGQSSSDKAIEVDEDGPPCVASTSPVAGGTGRFVVQRADGARTFSVLAVTDALDPYPRPITAIEQIGEAAFSWQMASPDTGGALVPVAGATGAELTIDPSAYAPGDLLDLRVEVDDRTERALPCDDAEPTCSASGDSCMQRLSWGVEIR